MGKTVTNLPTVSLGEREESIALAGDVLDAAERVRERLGPNASLADVVAWGIAVLDLARDGQLQLRDHATNRVQVVDIWKSG